MIVIIIIFLIATIVAFGMLSFRAWEIKTSRVESPATSENIIPEMYFRHLEKILMHLAKHIIQWIVLVVVKYWFIFTTKTKNWIKKKLPRLFSFLKKKPKDETKNRNTFFRRAVMESKFKIRRIKENVKREHEEIIEEVDKII